MAFPSHGCCFALTLWASALHHSCHSAVWRITPPSFRLPGQLPRGSSKGQCQINQSKLPDGSWVPILMCRNSPLPWALLFISGKQGAQPLTMFLIQWFSNCSCIRIFLGLLKHRWPGRTSRERLWSGRSGVGPEALRFKQVSRWCGCCWSGTRLQEPCFLPSIFWEQFWVTPSGLLSPLKQRKQKSCPISASECGIQVDFRTWTLSRVLLAGGLGQALRAAGLAGRGWEIIVQSGQMLALGSRGRPAELHGHSAFSCFSTLYSVSSLLIWGEINACKVLEKPSNCPYLPPGDTWYWLSLWKWFTGLLKPGKDQMLWASWSHLPSLLSASTRGGNWEIIDRRSFFGVLTRRAKCRRIISLGEKGF